jgi:hypothetical protein
MHGRQNHHIYFTAARPRKITQLKLFDKLIENITIVCRAGREFDPMGE